MARLAMSKQHRMGLSPQWSLTHAGRRALARGFLLAGALLAMSISGCQMLSPRAEPEVPLSTAQVVRGDMASVVHLAGQVAALEERALAFGTQGGRVLGVYVQTGQRVDAGQALVQLATSGLERSMREAQADLKVAEAALASAQRTSGAAEIIAAESDLAGAELELVRTEHRLAVAREADLDPLKDAVVDAESALQVAQDAHRMLEIQTSLSSIRSLEYQQAFFQRRLRDLAAGPEYDDAKAALIDVERQLTQARSARQNALGDAREVIALQERAVAQAKERLSRAESGEDDPLASLELAHEQALLGAEQARERLADLQSGVDSDAVQSAKTALDAAQARVEGAQEAIDAATLRAPFAGVIFQVFVRFDDLIQPSDTMVYLADPDALRVRAQATEADIARLRVGQSLRITFDARPGVFYDGEIVEIPMRSEQAGGMNVYMVEAALLNPDSAIRPGLLANARVLVGQKVGVLTIPSAAVQYRSLRDTYVSLVGVDGQAREQAVEIGMNDGIMAEVISGLQEGDTVTLPLVPPMDPSQRMGVMIAPDVIE